MEITSFALFGWSMALASILFFIFIYKKIKRTTAKGAGLRSNDGSADPDVKIVGQDEKYKRSTWWRKRSIPTHSGWLYPLTFDAEKGLKEA